MVNDNTGASNQARPSFGIYKTWLYSVWQDLRLGDFDIYFSSSNDGGENWGDGISNTDKRINDDIGAADQKNPDIAVNSKGDIFIIWQDFRYGNWDIFYSCSVDGGSSWTANAPVNGSDVWSSNQIKPVLTIDANDYIYVAFEDDGSGKSDINLIRSIDGGDEFSDAVAVGGSSTTLSQTDVDMVTGHDNSIHLVWSGTIDSSNSGIYYTRTTGNWPEFSDPVRADNGTKGVFKLRPSIDIFGTCDIYISWIENKNNLYNIYFDKIFDGESDFHEDIRVNVKADIVHAETAPDIVVTSVGLIYVAWILDETENHIVLSESQNGGISFIGETVVDTTSGLEAGLERIFPVIEKTGKDFFIAWEDYRNDPMPSDGIPDNSDIFFARVTGDSNQKPQAVYLQTEAQSWDRIRVEWGLSHEPDFYSYIVEIASSSDFEPLRIIKSVLYFERLINLHTFYGLVPETEYYLRVSVQDDGGFLINGPVVSVKTKSNTPPELSITEPDGVADYANNSYKISWTDDDPDDNATISIYFYHDLLGEKLIVIVPEGEDGSADSYVWNTTGLIEGDFTIKLVINDSYNIPIIRISSYPVHIDHRTDQEPPEIISVYPSETDEEAPLDTMIRVRFNEVFNTSSMENSITLYNPFSGTVPGTLSFDMANNTLIYNPDEKLELDTWYTVKFHGDVEDLWGNKKPTSLTWRFKTSPIEVAFINPYDGSSDVGRNESILITFSETMNTTTVEQTFNIDPPLNNLDFQWNLFNSSLTIKHSGFKPDQEYDLSLGPRLISKSGKILMHRLTISFRTAFINIAPELLDHGYFKNEDRIIFYAEYTDENDDPPGKSQIIIYKRNKFYENVSMIPLTRDIANLFKNYYEPGDALLDGIFNNSELFYYETELPGGKYRYYFEFEDVHGEPAISDGAPLTLINSADGPLISEEETGNTSLIITFTIMVIVILIIFLVLNLRSKLSRPRKVDGSEPENAESVDYDITEKDMAEKKSVGKSVISHSEDEDKGSIDEQKENGNQGSRTGLKKQHKARVKK